jgi:hypothetical protein
MKPQDHWTVIKFGIRSKLIALFVMIKVLPLILLAYFAWQGVEQLGLSLSQETDQLAEEVKTTVSDMSTRFARESVRALDDRAREELERLTTDTARAVADFCTTATATSCWPPPCLQTNSSTKNFSTHAHASPPKLAHGNLPPMAKAGNQNTKVSRLLNWPHP